MSLQQPGRGVNHFDPKAVTGDNYAGLLHADVVLSKFTLKSPDLIPSGIRKVDRQSDKLMDLSHKAEARQLGNVKLGEIGRIREGRVDTGTQFINNLQFVQPAFLRRGLANTRFEVDGKIQSFRLREGLHWFEKLHTPKQKPYHRQAPAPVTQYVVVVAYARCTAEEAAEALRSMDQVTIDGLRFIANCTYNFAHGFFNPDKTITLNFVGNVGLQKPKNIICVRNRGITAEATQAMMSEETESSESVADNQSTGPAVERLNIPTNIVRA